MSRFVITGATNGAPNRLEINDFVKNEKYFSLFIQALQAMQQDDQDNVPSYFQVGKIHGLPYKPWDGAFGSQGWNPSTTWGGYCAHGSVLFPTWHRPYMMLHEQIMQSYAVRIAATYTVDQDSWKEAAQTLRHPFWDWAVNAVPPDEVIAMPQVVITGPNGQKVSAHNPLHHYIFHPVDSSFPAPFRNWSTTIRHPTAQGPNATDNVARLKSVLQAAQSDITSSTYNMLTRIHDWPAFSNHTVGDGGSTSNSLEAVHDAIHGNVGGGGQMSDPSVAAFDPIFFLHHCNVDRLLQLWSALNPGVWVTRNEAGSGTYTIPPDTPVDQSTALTPFRNGQASYWNSSTLKDTTKLGYSYPDFDGVDLSNALAVQAAIANRVNQLYGSSIFSGLRPTTSGPISVDPIISKTPVGPNIPLLPTPSPIPISAQPPFGGVPPAGPVFGGGIPRGISQVPLAGPFVNTTDNLAADISANTPAGQARSVASESPSSTSVPIASVASNVYKPAVVTVPVTHNATPIYREAIPDQGLFDWTARIAVKKYEAGDSFGVLLFLGEVPNFPHDWSISPNYVGSHYAFVNTSTSECANCRSQADIVVEGFVHLNQAIIKHSGLNSLEPSVVEPYLTKNLHWRVQSVTGEPVNAGSLEISVYATPLSYPPDAPFPVPGERRLCNAITRGRRA